MTAEPNSIAIVGVGMSAALYLQRAGLSVAVIEPLPPGGGASYGSAGLLSVEACVPIAMPGMLKQVPRWLNDPLGPLAVRPSYLPKALPWLMRLGWRRPHGAGRSRVQRAARPACGRARPVPGTAWARV